MLPYDGSPGGNALGMQFDEQLRRSHEATVAAALDVDDGPSTPLQMAAALLGLIVFLVVMLYGTVG
ncbi:hypothetical protein [Novosphingobium sp. AP12]|uniref:hypothetical protein n=1 Tax=Novosphingobium sp. AP12 TaxID=1144305 RepID=UPI000271F671|nr:hypothetical protein [Novosphingobium sp. AP12]EJL24248.1 hypothetical protein PMI02_03750 [Novosphingobium sp. AP12]